MLSTTKNKCSPGTRQMHMASFRQDFDVFLLASPETNQKYSADCHCYKKQRHPLGKQAPADISVEVRSKCT